MYDALISMKPTYVEMLISGDKAVEIRNRSVNLQPNSRIWIYSTLPKGCVQAVAQVLRVEVGSPVSIWRKHHCSVGISKRIYYHYVNGSSAVSAILVKRIWKLPFDLSLKYLRNRVPGFHPPQSLRYMNDDDPVLSAIVDFLKTNGIHLQF